MSQASQARQLPAGRTVRSDVCVDGRDLESAALLVIENGCNHVERIEMRNAQAIN